MKNFHTIQITPASNGITVKAGCLLIVYQQTQLNIFHDDLARYLNDPIATEKEIRKRWHIEQGEDTEAPTEEREPRPSISRAEPAERETAEKAADTPR